MPPKIAPRGEEGGGKEVSVVKRTCLRRRPPRRRRVGTHPALALSACMPSLPFLQSSPQQCADSSRRAATGHSFRHITLAIINYRLSEVLNTHSRGDILFTSQWRVINIAVNDPSRKHNFDFMGQLGGMLELHTSHRPQIKGI